MINILNNSKIRIALFCSIFLMQTIDNIFTQFMYPLQGEVKIFKNFFLILVLLIMFFSMKISIKTILRLKFVREVSFMTAGILVIAIISFYLAITQDNFNLITVTALIKMLFPLYVSFILINAYTIEEIECSMKLSLFITFFGYLFFDIMARGLTINDIMSISFVNSFSPFESHYFSPQAMAFCCYFMYYRQNKITTILSLVFVFMTYKRIMIFGALFLFITPYIFNPDYRVKKYIPVFVILFYIFVSYFLLYILKTGNVNILGISFDQLTMGRSYFFRQLMETNYSSFGLNSSIIALGRDIEMDLIKLLLEVGILGLSAYIVSLVAIVKDKLYNIMLVVFVLGISLISHFFDITYFWIVYYITIYCISIDQKYLDTNKLIVPRFYH